MWGVRPTWYMHFQAVLVKWQHLACDSVNMALRPVGKRSFTACISAMVKRRIYLDYYTPKAGENFIRTGIHYVIRWGGALPVRIARRPRPVVENLGFQWPQTDSTASYRPGPSAASTPANQSIVLLFNQFHTHHTHQTYTIWKIIAWCSRTTCNNTGMLIYLVAHV